MTSDAQANGIFRGGGVEAGESPNEAAARELMEEAGLQVDARSLALVYAATSYYDITGDSNTRVLFSVKISDKVLSGGIKLSHEHSEYKWQPIEDALEEHPHPVYRAGLQYALDHDLLA